MVINYIPRYSQPAAKSLFLGPRDEKGKAFFFRYKSIPLRSLSKRKYILRKLSIKIYTVQLRKFVAKYVAEIWCAVRTFQKLRKKLILFKSRIEKKRVSGTLSFKNIHFKIGRLTVNATILKKSSENWNISLLS